MSEQWRQVPGHPAYDVSDQGRIRSWKCRSKWGLSDSPANLSLSSDKGGYLRCLVDRKNKYPHIVVLEAFIGPRPGPGFHASHLNGDNKDNRLVNLCWETASQNNRRRVAHARQA